MLAVALMKTALIVSKESPVQALQSMYESLKEMFEPPGSELQPESVNLTLSPYDPHWLRKMLLF